MIVKLLDSLCYWCGLYLMAALLVGVVFSFHDVAVRGKRRGKPFFA